MNRSGFLRRMIVAPFVAGAVLAAVSRVPVLYGDGIADDTVALQAWYDGKTVLYAGGGLVGHTINGGTYKLSDTIELRSGKSVHLVGGTVRSSADYPFRVHYRTFRVLFPKARIGDWRNP